MSYTYEYPRPALTVDCVIFGLDDSQDLRILLIQRPNPPFAGAWALPGGYVRMDEDLETAAKRELSEKTKIKDVFIEQLYTFGAPNRDERGRVVSVAYYALVNLEKHPISSQDNPQNAAWHKAFHLPQALAFDHADILHIAIQRLQNKIKYQPIGFELLPQHFTLTQLQSLYEKILNRPLNKRNFRAKINKMGILEKLTLQKDVAHRPAFLYQFDPHKYAELTQTGFIFEL
jgi:8-oxo-dGTP diphosphatase